MKKKLMAITTIVIIIALVAAGTAFAANGLGDPVEAADGTGYGHSTVRGAGQRFAVQADEYDTEEEFHAAVLAQKLAIIETKLADGSISQEDADEVTAHLTACDGTCETEGENPDRPEDGWGIFGQAQSGGQGLKGAGNRGAGMNSEDCDGEGVPLNDGSGSETARGYRNGRSK